jgi:YVTN family beta-propeller protein
MGIAVTPDGKRVYVTNAHDGGLHLVSVIDTASKQVVATVAGVGYGPLAIAITPDGNYAYVTNLGSNTISVIATASNMVVDTIPVGNGPSAVGIVPPPPGVPFLAFKAKLEINYRRANEDVFELQSNFTLGGASHGMHPETDSVKLEIGTFTVTIPAGSFEGKGFGPFEFRGVIDGVDLHVDIEPTGAKRYDLKARARDANLIGTTNPVQVTLVIGDDSGTVSVKATKLSEVAWLGRRRVP